MYARRGRINAPWALIGVAGLALGACGSPSHYGLQEVTASCGALAAQIQVGDAYLQRVCGCAEGSSVPITEGAAFNCTVARGASLSFNYLSSTMHHQIVSLGTPSQFAPSGIGVPVHVVKFPDAGIFPFGDAFNPQIQGRIIVL